VRELENVISSASITSGGDFIDIADLPEGLQHRGPRTAEGDEWRPLSLDEMRNAHIIESSICARESPARRTGIGHRQDQLVSLPERRYPGKDQNC